MAAQGASWVGHAGAGAGQTSEVVGVAATRPERFDAARGNWGSDRVETDCANRRGRGCPCGVGRSGRDWGWGRMKHGWVCRGGLGGGGGRPWGGAGEAKPYKRGAEGPKRLWLGAVAAAGGARDWG